VGNLSFKASLFFVVLIKEKVKGDLNFKINSVSNLGNID